MSRAEEWFYWFKAGRKKAELKDQVEQLKSVVNEQSEEIVLLTNLLERWNRLPRYYGSTPELAEATNKALEGD